MGGGVSGQTEDRKRKGLGVETGRYRDKQEERDRVRKI